MAVLLDGQGIDNMYTNINSTWRIQPKHITALLFPGFLYCWSHVNWIWNSRQQPLAGPWWPLRVLFIMCSRRHIFRSFI